jgi:acyl-CoA thioester hydrolase
LCYKMEKEVNKNIVVVAVAKTGMVCYNYEKKKITAVPEEITLKFSI